MTAPIICILPTASATAEFGHALGIILPERVVVTLSGPLGAGKTTLVQGIVKSRTTEEISSPTFVYHQRYETPRGPIDHVDLYRMQTNESQLGPSGVLDLVEEVPGWLLIEWPLPDLPFPTAIPRIAIEATGAPHFSFSITSSDPLLQQRIQELA